MKFSKPLFLTALLALGSCSYLPDWLGSGDDKILPGKRYAVMDFGNALHADETIAADEIDIPAIDTTSSFGQNFGNYSFKSETLQISTTSAGSAPESGFILTHQPLVADGKVYVIDGKSEISSFDLKTMSKEWSTNLTPPEEDSDLPGGGLSYAYGTLYAGTGYGAVSAISASDGSVLWQKNLGSPIRKPPVVAGEKVYISTIDNQLFCLNAVDGANIWHHAGTSGTTGFYGGAAPIVKNDTAVIAYSSGEIFGLSALRGDELWSEIVSLGADATEASSKITDVAGSPIVVDGIVYVGSNSGDLTALNLTNGFRIWSQKVGSVMSTPWVAGRYIYVITKDHKIAALNRFDGRVKWVNDLPKPEKKEKIAYVGPFMTGDNLYVIMSNGKMLKISPQDGSRLKQFEIPENIYTVPVIMDGEMLVLDKDANLVVIK